MFTFVRTLESSDSLAKALEANDGPGVLRPGRLHFATGDREYVYLREHGRSRGVLEVCFEDGMRVFRPVDPEYALRVVEALERDGALPGA